MKPGTVYEGEVELFAVTIDGRGGDSVTEMYFQTKRAGIIASFRDGGNKKPKKVSAEKFSDGTWKYDGHIIGVVPTVSELTAEEQKSILGSLTPVQRLLFQKLCKEG